MFNYNGKNKKLIYATKKANDIVLNNNFLNEISDCTFDMATCDGERISLNIKKAVSENRKLFVIGYVSMNPFTKALAYFDKRKPDHIFINEKKLNRSLGSITGTLVHELIHYLDNLDENHYFGHGDNSKKGKENTAPYYIGNLACKIISGIENFNNIENQNISTKLGFFGRLKRFFGL